VTGFRTVVAATTNEHKLAEIAAILTPLGYEVISRAAAGVPDFEIEETGATFEENSLLKARVIFDWLGGRFAALADDSGIEADALGGAPGVFSARFAGQRGDGAYAVDGDGAYVADGDGAYVADVDGAAADFAAADLDAEQAHRSRQDRANNAKLLRLLEGIPLERRTGRFVSVITCIRPGAETLVCRGEVEGKIDFKETGKAGFGYDPLFIPEGYDHSFGLFSPEDKNAISHRGAALEKLAARLAEEAAGGAPSC